MNHANIKICIRPKKIGLRQKTSIFFGRSSPKTSQYIGNRPHIHGNCYAHSNPEDIPVIKKNYDDPKTLKR